MNAEFIIASEAAYEWLDLIGVIESLAAEGKQDEAKRCLKAFDGLMMMHGKSLTNTQLEVASVAEGPIIRNGSTGPQYHSSAHDAVHSLWIWLGLLGTYPEFEVPVNFTDWLGINLSQLAASLLRERAKLISKSVGFESLPTEVAVDEKDVPAEFRELKKADGAILTAPYLTASDEWRINGPTLTNKYNPEKGPLTRRIKVGKARAYLYDELCVVFRSEAIKPTLPKPKRKR